MQTSGGTSFTDGAGDDFLYILAAPTVTSISETSGPAAGGSRRLGSAPGHGGREPGPVSCPEVPGRRARGVFF